MSEARDDDDLLQAPLGDVERAEMAELDETDDPLDDSEDSDDADGDADDAPDGDAEPEDPRDAQIRELKESEERLQREIDVHLRANSIRQDEPRDPHLQAQMERLGAAIEEGGEPAGGLLSLIQYEQQLHMLQVKDMLDQQNLRTIVREKGLPARYENEVEWQLSYARRQGMNPTREMVLQTILGREALAKWEHPETEKQRQRGQRRIASQTVRPNGRGSTAASSDRRGRNQDAEDEALLRSITWGDANRG